MTRPEVYLGASDDESVMVVCGRESCLVTDPHKGRRYSWCGDLPLHPTVEQAAEAVAAHIATHDRMTL